MADVIDIEKARAARNAPDSSCVSTNSDGHDVYLFAVTYRHNGRRYSVDIWALSLDDAEQHVAAMRECLSLDGQTVSLTTW